MGDLTEEQRAWYEMAQAAEDHIASMSWRELGPAGRLLKFGFNPERMDALIVDGHKEDGVLHLDVALRLTPDPKTPIKINVVQL